MPRYSARRRSCSSRWCARNFASVSSSRCLANHSVTSSGTRICSGAGSRRIHSANARRPDAVIANGCCRGARVRAARTKPRASSDFSSRYTWLDVTFQNRASPRRTSSIRSQPVAGPSCRNPAARPGSRSAPIARDPTDRSVTGLLLTFPSGGLARIVTLPKGGLCGVADSSAATPGRRRLLRRRGRARRRHRRRRSAPSCSACSRPRRTGATTSRATAPGASTRCSRRRACSTRSRRIRWCSTRSTGCSVPRSSARRPRSRSARASARSRCIPTTRSTRSRARTRSSSST